MKFQKMPKEFIEEFAAKEKLEIVLSAPVPAFTFQFRSGRQGEAGGRGVWGEFRPPSPESSVRIFSNRHRQVTLFYRSNPIARGGSATREPSILKSSSFGFYNIAELDRSGRSGREIIRCNHQSLWSILQKRMMRMKNAVSRA
jgi:hypothetical protein